MTDSTKIQWTTALETGHLATDNQHKVFIDIINELADAIETGQVVTKLEKILNLLQYYAEWHFEREEICMETCKCPAGPANKEAHQLFIKKLAAFSVELRKGASLDLATKMYKEMTDWLVDHIQGIDLKLRDYVKKAG